MATVVYQGYQSYFESQHFEPRALRLRLSSPNTSTPLKSLSLDSSITIQENISTNTNAASLSSDSNSGSSSASKTESWSFLEALSNSSSDDQDKKKTLSSPYVQPKSSRRNLSDESLALCTESLGSETGSDVINDEDFFSISSEYQTVEVEARTSITTSRLTTQVRKSNAMASLPPPLTSMSGTNGIQVKSHRENGRLVMMVSSSPLRNRCLQDRSNGCVRLAILVNSDDQETEETKEEEEEEETFETQEEEEEEEDVEEVEEAEEIKVMSIEKVQRSRRCVEGERENRGFLNWESFCVATS